MKMKIVLALVSVLFIGILIGTYIVTKRANPIMLDERGRPLAAGQANGHGR
jgi:uncharacterized protein YneF (UPF0154 family)